MVSLSGDLKAFTLPLLLRKFCMMPVLPLGGARMLGPYSEGLNLLKVFSLVLLRCEAPGNLSSTFVVTIVYHRPRPQSCEEECTHSKMSFRSHKRFTRTDPEANYL